MSMIGALLCSKCSDVVLTFQNATEPLPKCEEQLFQADVCQIDFHVNYLKREIRLNLTGDSILTGNDHLNLYVQNKFDEPRTIDTNVTYACKTKNDCAKLFYRSVISRLVGNEQILHEIEGELFDPKIIRVDQCVDNNDRPVKCQNGYGCHGFEIIENGKTDFEGECRNDSSVTIFPRAYFRITLVQSDPMLPDDWNHLGFTCNKRNICNSRQQIKKMVKLADEFYPWEFIALNSNAKIFTTFTYIALALVLVFLENVF